MRKYRREVIEAWVKIYFMKEKLQLSFKEIAECEGLNPIRVQSNYTRCVNILDDKDHPNHDDVLECYDEIKKQSPGTPVLKEKIRDSSKTIYQSKPEILFDLDSVQQLENKIAEEKVNLAGKVDKMKMPVYAQFSSILSEYFLFLNSLSKEELDQCYVKEDKIPAIDVLLNKLKVLDVDVQAITTIEKYLVIKEFPPFWIKFSENFMNDFGFKRKVLEELLLYMKDPGNSKLKMEDFRKYLLPFGRFFTT